MTVDKGMCSQYHVQLPLYSNTHRGCMILTPELKEIIQYLHTKDHYAVFAGFCAFLLTGVEPSFDIDVFVLSADTVKQITEDFIKKGWRIQYTADGMGTVKKNDTTFDIIYSKPAKIFLCNRIQVSFKGYRLFVITPEALFLTKMNQLTSLKRTEEKTKRDRDVIHILRQKIDVEKLRTLLQTVDDSFWTKGV